MIDSTILIKIPNKHIMSLDKAKTPIFWLSLSSCFCILLFSCHSSNSSSVSDVKKMANSKEQLKIEYIAHASFLLTYRDHTLLLDPFADSVWISYTFPRNIKADAIFSTHPHYDHDGGLFRDLKPYWESEIAFYQDPGNYEIGNFRIQGIKGKHCEPYGYEFDQKNTIFIFEVADLRIAHWGDNEPINDALAEQLTDIDVLMLPIDDSYHILKADETAEVINRINPKVIIPMHYKITDLEPTPDKPKNLETIDKYIGVRQNVIKLEGNKKEITQSDLPSSQEYWVFKHSPLVK
tara:strand:+ start:805 stop:1683 length:879 start_codon:yes stop_codon:yes gene_type:complete